MKEDLKDYDNLECPYCDKVCKPSKVLKDGTCVYQKHECKHSSNYQFKININGDLID